MPPRPKSPIHSLSKSLYIRGLQCRKALYFEKHRPELRDELTTDAKARFAAGNQVGELARDLFPGGELVPYVKDDFAIQFKQTSDAVASGKRVIYEASFEHDGITVKVDILRKVAKGWQIYEVKSGTALKEVHEHDAALQYFVLTGAGIPVTRVFVVHLNSEYVRRGDLDLAQLFTVVDVTKEAKAQQAEIAKEIAAQRKMLSGKKPPKIDIGPHCSIPYECDFGEHCWQHIPENSVFDLAGKGVDQFELYRNGMVSLKDVPLDLLKGKQRQQAEAAAKKKVIVDRERLRKFLDQLWYPLCFLDFETFQSPVPPYDGLRPYQQVPFQYSLHYQKRQNGKLYHREFLTAPATDPREEFIERLLADIPEGSCILAYYKAFEIGRLKELAEHFPRYRKKIQAIIDNVVDLIEPFQQRMIYSWKQRGSHSIKQVLPAFVKGMSYEGMTISDGGEAMEAYHEMCALVDRPEELAELRQALLEYCRQDTLAMVRLVEILERQ
ncbi:DUF2779 domain-containing protein [Geobacter sp.]|uniref:DUF2779 domain-containing protein n=1 Tax=Geobacter sp. TaxID=46610 RepID=UPI0026134B57|nr:DUF2779 domain-containing protein [Geobacter sp.]